MSRVVLTVLLLILLASAAFSQTAESRDAAGIAPISILLIMDHRLGGNWDVEDQTPSIREQFAAFGWRMTTTALFDTVTRCDYSQSIGLQPVAVDTLLDELENFLDYDIICLLPNNTGMENVKADTATLSRLSEAADSGRIVAGWCRSGRVLAAAGLLNGRDAVGHADLQGEYEAAGANYLGNDHPPVTQGNIVTSTRSRFYRTAMCEAIKAAAEEQRTQQSTE